jgi:LysM repeat protein
LDPKAQDRLVFECAPACKKAKAKCRKGKPATRRNCARLPEKGGDGKLRAMKWTVFVAILVAAVFPGQGARAQTFASAPAETTEASELRALAKKIDEQNAKIDTLSQQILQLERELAKMRPGVMIGEATPAPTRRNQPTAAERSAKADASNSYIVGRGETLTSIARAHNVSVSELQSYNHIENPLKLQAGQTILIPPSATPAASASSSGN